MYTDPESEEFAILIIKKDMILVKYLRIVI